MKRTSRNKGFTLLELIITVAILALVVAPFLSSFITAGNLNTKSKRKQVATTYSEYLSEKFKAKTLDKLLEDYDGSISAGGIYSLDSTDGHYEFDITEVPQGVSNQYTAKVTLRKSTVAVNDDDATPVLTDVDSSTTYIAMNDFYKNDLSYNYGSTTFRKSYITVSYNSTNGLYNVALDIQYIGGGHNSGIINVSTCNYQVMPDLYLMYVPLSSNDTIEISNEVNPTDMLDADGNPKEMRIWFTKQDVIDASNPAFTTPDIATGNIKITSVKNLAYTSKYMTDFIVNDGVCTGMDGIKVFTNMSIPTKVGSLVAKQTVTSLYDMTIEVFYNGNSVATFSSTKTRED